MVPVDLEVLLHCHYKSNEPIRDAPAYRRAVDKLLFAETIKDNKGSFTTTDRGKKWLEMLLVTPFPTLQWEEPYWEDPRKVKT